MEVQELISKVKALDIKMKRELTPETIRKLASDGYITPPPRYKTSGPKGRGAASDWPDAAVQETAAYFRVREVWPQIFPGLSSLPRENIKEARKVGLALINKPSDLCWPEVHDNGFIDLTLYDGPPYVFLASSVELLKEFEAKEREQFSKRYGVDYNLEREAKSQINSLLNYFRTNPYFCFLTKTHQKAAVAELLTAIDHFQKSLGLPLSTDTALASVLPDVATWIATYEKVKLRIPVSMPLVLVYNWTINAKLKKRPSYHGEGSESPFYKSNEPVMLVPTADTSRKSSRPQNEADTTYTFDKLDFSKRLHNVNETQGEACTDRVYLRYSIYVSYED